MKDEAAPPTREQCRILSSAGAGLPSLPQGAALQGAAEDFSWAWTNSHCPDLSGCLMGLWSSPRLSCFGFLAPTSAVCLPLLCCSQTRIFLFICHIFPSPNQGCFTKVPNFTPRIPFCLFFFPPSHHSTPSAASPASPAPSPARCSPSSPPSP